MKKTIFLSGLLILLLASLGKIQFPDFSVLWASFIILGLISMVEGFIIKDKALKKRKK
jgi:hypothetical protein